MRKLRNLIVIITLLSLNACNTLELKPEGFISPEVFYKNENEAFMALTGVYNPLANESFYGRDWFYAFNIQDDLGYYDRNYTNEELFLNNFSYTNARVNNLWKNLYTGVNRANSFLENIDRVSFKDDALKEAYRGEAMFLRAYYYFILSSMWGDVPFRDKSVQSVSQESQIEATSTSDVFNFVVNEMEAAVPKVYDADKLTAVGRISKSTVQGILARVYLKMAGYPLNQGKPAYEKALFWGNEVKKSAKHSLNTDYTKVFINYAQDVTDVTFRESIWEIEFKGNRLDGHETAGLMGSYNGIYNNDNISEDTPGWCYGYLSCTLKLEDLYKLPEDAVRKGWNVAAYRYNYNATTKVRTKTNWTTAQLVYRNAGKFRREYELVSPKAKDYTPINFPVLRYADVLLMIAEADNEINAIPSNLAYECLNLVRKRAMPSAPAVAGLTQGTFRQMIRDERARELCFEGERKNDLIRWGIYVDAMTNGRTMMVADSRWHVNKKYASAIANYTSERHVLYPIPSSELATNHKMKQSPLW
jgi:hypothetical protein